MPKPLRGEIWLVQFRPAIGAEIQKARPAVVMNPSSIGRLPLAIVVPLTEWKPAYEGFSWFVSLRPSARNGLAKDSGADAFQVKSVSEARLIERVGVLEPADVEDIARAVALCVGCQF